jgi:hypothetical protein
LAGTLFAGDVYVLCHPSIDPSVLPVCDVLDATLNHNGDDSYELVCDGATIDVFGTIGVDPGVGWGVNPLDTVDVTLRRKASITSGNTNGFDDFAADLINEWDAFPSETFDGLGAD